MKHNEASDNKRRAMALKAGRLLKDRLRFDNDNAPAANYAEWR